MAYIAATSTAFPSHYYNQEELSSELRNLWIEKGLNVKIFDRIQKNVQVKGRHLALPIEKYNDINSFEESNNAWIEVALELGEQTIQKIFDSIDLSPSDISMIMSTTVTGIAVPSIEARLMNRIDFPNNLKRIPIFGLGCLAGVAGMARVADYLKGHPKEAAILLSVELCSLTIQRKDISIANIVSSGLFGDGASAVLMLGEEHPLVKKGQGKVVDSESVFFPDSERVMGWDISGDGLKIVLSPGVPKYARENLRPAVDKFLAKHNLELKDITHWVAHPGGPKVIKAMEEALELDSEALSITKSSLEEIGNLSSSSVLTILDQTISTKKPKSGSYGLMISFGPAFCAELALLQW